jgi:hypothetical protein
LRFSLLTVDATTVRFMPVAAEISADVIPGLWPTSSMITRLFAPFAALGRTL